MPTDSTTPADAPLVEDHEIESRIYLLRGRKVMLDVDLARLYGVPTKRLNEQVKRNLGRFPEDFLFRLSKEELETLRAQLTLQSTPSLSGSQNATLSDAESPSRRGKNVKYAPYAFTEHGVTMLSAVLRSERAVTVSVAVVRAFVRMREVLATQTTVIAQVEALEQRVTYHDGQLTLLFDLVHGILAPEPESEQSHPVIGFTTPESSRGIAPLDSNTC